MALGPFSVSYDRSKVVDYSKHITMDNFGIFLPRPRLEKDLASFAKPLSWQVINKIVFINVYVLCELDLKHIYTQSSALARKCWDVSWAWSIPRQEYRHWTW